MKNKSPFFLPYQMRWLKDKSKVKIWEKSRRIGATYVQSYEDVRDCVYKKVPAVWFSSADESAAKEYIDYCEQWVKVFNMSAKSLGEVIIDSDKDIKALVIEFKNGTKIHALSSNPKAFRSKGGKVVLDEFAFHKSAMELWQAARPCITWGYPLRILSTHNGQNCLYYKFIDQTLKGNCTKFKEVIMTTITDAEALKSKANFTSYVEEHSKRIIEEALNGYPQHSLHIIYPQLTPSADGLMEAVGNLVDEQKAYIFYFVANEKEEVFKVIKVLNQNFTDYCGIFVFKAELNNDKIEFKTILKPTLITKSKRIVNIEAPAKLFQKQYWEKYFEICDELQSEMQVNPKPQHFQYIPIGKRGVQIMQTVNTKLNLVATEIFINNDQEIFNKLSEHKTEIEKELGYLEWQPIEGKKSSRIRKTLGVDISKEENLERAIKLQIQTAEDFKQTFCKYL